MQDDELSLLFPEPRLVRLIASEVSLLPLRIGKLPAFSKAITPSMAYLTKGQFKEAIDDHYPTLRTAVSISSEMSEDDLDKLFLDEFTALLVGVVEVNLDFFNRRVMPQMTALFGLVGTRLPEAPAGSPSAPSLPDGDTAEPSSPA